MVLDTSQQNALPSMPAVPMTLNVFFDTWVREHPDETNPWLWDSVRQSMGADVPRRFMPSWDGLIDEWWTERFNKLCKSRGIRKLQIDANVSDDTETSAEPERPPAIGLRWRQAAFDEFFQWQVECVKKAAEDLSAVDVRVEVYAQDHPELNLDIEQTKALIRSAAGLAIIAA